MKTAEIKKIVSGYHVYGYVDETHGVVRFYKNGEQELYFYQSNGEFILDGHKKNSNKAKHILKEVCEELTSMMEAQ